jgi:hypothetical protein
MMLLLAASVFGMSSNPATYRTRALSEDVTFELSTDRDTYVVGEPVGFHFSLRNTSASTLDGHFMVGPMSPLLDLHLRLNGAGADRVVRLQQLDPKSIHFGALRERRLGPNETISADWTAAFDWVAGTLLLDKPGSYEFRAHYTDQTGDLNSALESNAWWVKVQRPPDIHTDAFELYAKLNPSLTQFPGPDPLAVSGEQALTGFDFVERFPDSPWTAAVKRGLLNVESYRVPYKLASPDEEKRYRLLGEREQAARRRDP